MTLNSRPFSFSLLLLHCAILLFLSFYFLGREDYLLQYMHYKLPLHFLLRFGVFWFISFVFTLLVYLSYVRRYQLQMPVAERSFALLTGKYAFSFGAVAAALLMLLVFYLYNT
ncbi:hypothetical protein ACXYMU_18360 [Pontibacter sp. CAU 1760]